MSEVTPGDTLDVVGKLRELDQKATPGRWRFSDSTDVTGNKGEFRAPNPYNGFMLIGAWCKDADIRLMLDLRNALPAIVKLVEACERHCKGGLDQVLAAGRKDTATWDYNVVHNVTGLNAAIANLSSALESKQ